MNRTTIIPVSPDNQAIMDAGRNIRLKYGICAGPVRVISCTLVLIVSLILIVHPFAAAQTPSITLDRAIQIGLEKNTALQRAENNTTLSEISVQQQRSRFLPNLQFSTRGAQNYGRYFSQDEGRILNESTQSVAAGLSTSLTLFDGFQNVASLNEARALREAAIHERDRMRQTVAMNVIERYLGMLEADQQVMVRREALIAQEEQEVRINELVDAGSRSVADLYQQQATVAGARLALVEAQRGYEVSKEDLIQTLQLDPTGDYSFEEVELDDRMPRRPYYEVGELVHQAMDRRMDLSATEARMDAAEYGIRTAQASRWPTVALTGGYDTGFNSTSSFGLMDQLDQRRGGAIGLSISVPLFDRSAAKQQSERAQVQLENMRLDLQDRTQQVVAEVRRAHLDYAAAHERVDAAEAQLQAAERALTHVSERYEVGAATLVELVQSRAIRIEAESRLIQARYNTVAQEKLLAYYTGALPVQP